MGITRGRTAIDGFFKTTLDLISYKGKPKVNQIFETDGFTTPGDSSGEKWKATGNVIAASQNNSNIISDANGNEFIKVLQKIDMIRKSKLDNPLTHILKKNKLVDTLSGALSWTRATTATYVDRYGVVKTAAINAPREEAEGWLLEGASTNLALYSEDFSNAAWFKVSGVTITPNSITAPDGNLTASTIDFASTGDKFCVQHINYAIGSINTITASLYVKAGTSSIIQLRTILFGTQMQDISSVFDAITGTWTNVGIGHTVTVKKLSGGWYRISATTIDNGTGSPSVEIRIQVTNLTGNHYIWGAQVEALPFATSYTPTTTAAVTRAADIVIVQNVANDTSDVNNGFSSVVSMSDLRFKADFDNVVVTESSSGVNYVLISNSATDLYSALVRTDATSTYSRYAPLSLLPKKAIYATTVSNGTHTSYVNNTIDISNGVDTDNGLGFLNAQQLTLFISKNHTAFFHIKDFRIYDFALNADEVSFLSGE